MSQEKVDKYKAEKKNREKTIKKNKAKKVFVTLICAALLGVIIGFPLGRIMYNQHYKQKMANATISAGIYDYWFSEHWNMNYSDKFSTSFLSGATFSDDEVEELIDELSSNTDAIVVSPEDVDTLEDALDNSK